MSFVSTNTHGPYYMFSYICHGHSFRKIYTGRFSGTSYYALSFGWYYSILRMVYNAIFIVVFIYTCYICFSFLSFKKWILSYLCLWVYRNDYCFTVCTFYPNGLELRLSNIGRENILIDLVHFLYNNDTPTNVFPSLHVYVTISAHICLVKSPHMQGLNSRKHIKVISLILAILICMSTLFLKQHSVLDVLAEPP